MDYEWDEEKNEINRRKHGLDFADAERVMDGIVLAAEDESEIYGEQRMRCLGMLEERVVLIAYTVVGDVTRIFSMRKADKNERKTYFEEALGIKSSDQK